YMAHLPVEGQRLRKPFLRSDKLSLATGNVAQVFQTIRLSARVANEAVSGPGFLQSAAGIRELTGIGRNATQTAQRIRDAQRIPLLPEEGKRAGKIRPRFLPAVPGHRYFPRAV